MEACRYTIGRWTQKLGTCQLGIQGFQQWPDLKPTYADTVTIDSYVFFDDILVHEVVYSSYRYYHY